MSSFDHVLPVSMGHDAPRPVVKISTPNRAILPMCMAAVFACGLGLPLTGALASLIEGELHVSHATLGLLQGAFFVGFIGGSIAVPILLRRFGAVWIIAFSMLCISAGPMVCGIKCVPATAIGRLLCGLGTTGLMLFMSLLFAQSYRRHQAALNCLMHASLAIGSVTSLFFARSVADRAGSFAVPCWTVGTIALLLTIPVIFSARGIAVRPDPVGGSAKKVLASPIFLATLAIVIAYMLAEQGSTAFASLLAEERLGLSPAAAARAGALLWAGMIAGRVATAWVSRKVRIELNLLMCIVLTGIFGLLAVGTKSPAVFASSLFLTGVFGGPILALISTLQCQRLPANESIALSLSAIALGIGGAAGPAILGQLSQEMGIGRALGLSYFILPATGGILVIALLWLVARISFGRAVPHLRVEIGRWRLLLARDVVPNTEMG